MSNVFNKLTASLALAALLQSSVLVPHVSAAKGELHVGLKSKSCAEQVQSVTYRSELLAVYKNAQFKKQAAFHKKWQTRISYAGQWVPNEAEKTRDSLYELDALAAATQKEVDAQIVAGQKLHSLGLDCTPAKKKLLSEQVALVDGQDGNSGNAKINRLHKEQSKYQDEKFAKQSQKMLKKLHAVKDKHQKPTHNKLSVK